MEYKSFMEALKGKQHKIDKNKNGQIDAHDFKLLRKEESELNEGTADELGDSIDNAKSTEHAKSIISKAPTKHLQYLHHWNMGLSGARTHKDMPHIKAELTSRKAVLSNAESSKRFDEQVDLDEATVKTQKYDGGKVMTVHHGASHSYPLHPEHQEAIRNLKHGEKTSFKDETGAKVNVHRDVQDVHFTSNKTSTKTTVPHSNFSEETELDEIHRMKTKLNKLDDISNKSVARQKLSNLMKSGKARGALIANKMRTLNMGEEVEIEEGVYSSDVERAFPNGKASGVKTHAPVAPVPDRKYIKGTPENKALKASRKPINGMPTNEEVEQIEEKSEQAKQNKTLKNMMDASRGARHKLNNPVPAAEPEHKTARAHNVAIGRALRNEDKMTTTKDKSGKLVSFKYEGDWKKSTEKKQGSGKAANLAGQAMQKMKKMSEEKDEQEYGYEGDMAMNQLSTLIRCAEMIKDTLKPDTDLPEWVQSKITLASDYIVTAADYLHSELEEGYYEKPASAYRRKGDEVGGGSSKAVSVKVNHAGDEPHEEKWEPVKKIKKPVKESFDDEGNLISNKVSYKEFMLEYTPGPGGVTQVKGRSYGANYSDPEGADDADDNKPMKPAAEKRGRGRPAGAKSGARKITGTSKLMNK